MRNEICPMVEKIEDSVYRLLHPEQGQLIISALCTICVARTGELCEYALDIAIDNSAWDLVNAIAKARDIIHKERVACKRLNREGVAS